MSNFKCQICQTVNPEPSHFWKMHKIKESLYYLTYFPKFDKLTGDVLSFKDRDSYLLTNFANKNNFKKWFKLQDIVTRQKYLKELLLNRKNLKNWIHTPTQAELRSAPELVGIKTFNDTFKENYYDLCAELGFKSRGFINLNEKTILKSTRTLRGNPILVDSRESNYLSFGNKEIQVTTMNVGDYTIKNDNYNIVIERKEISDGISTLSSGYERFRKELIRAQESNIYIIMLFESPINDFLSFNYLPWISKKIQATPSFVTHRLRLLLQEFPLNFQVGFCNGRGHMKEVILKIFEMEDKTKFFDVQLALDLDLLSNKI